MIATTTLRPVQWRVLNRLRDLTGGAGYRLKTLRQREPDLTPDDLAEMQAAELLAARGLGDNAAALPGAGEWNEALVWVYPTRRGLAAALDDVNRVVRAIGDPGTWRARDIRLRADVDDTVLRDAYDAGLIRCREEADQAVLRSFVKPLRPDAVLLLTPKGRARVPA